MTYLKHTYDLRTYKNYMVQTHHLVRQCSEMYISPLFTAFCFLVSLVRDYFCKKRIVGSNVLICLVALGLEKFKLEKIA